MQSYELFTNIKMQKATLEPFQVLKAPRVSVYTEFKAVGLISVYTETHLAIGKMQG